MTEETELYPETAMEAFELFKKGEAIHVIEIGGMGPGYEQALWNGIFSMIEEFKDADGVKHWVKNGTWVKAPGEEYRTEADVDCLRVLKGNGLSGAQADAIKSTVYQVLTFGWRYMMKKAPSDRMMMVSRNPPQFKAKDEA